MRLLNLTLGGGLVLLTIGLAVWLSRMPPAPTQAAENQPARSTSSTPVLRLGIVPERDIYAQRQRFRALADYLSAKLNRPVELVTLGSYLDILQDFKTKQVDAAFLGSLVATLAIDREQAQIIAKPESDSGIGTYRGMIFVRDDSPIRDLSQLAGSSVAAVRTTMAGQLFPVYTLHEAGLRGASLPRFIWLGTHDDVVREVLAGKIPAGAAKDLRLTELLKDPSAPKIRILATSSPVPDNALLVRNDLAGSLAPILRDALLGMINDPEGRKTLGEFGAARFVACQQEEFGPIYEMADRLGIEWSELGIEGPRPVRPNAATTASGREK